MFRPSQNLHDGKICSFTEIFTNDIKFLVQRIKTKCTQFSLKGQNLHWYHSLLMNKLQPRKIYVTSDCDKN